MTQNDCSSSPVQPGSLLRLPQIIGRPARGNRPAIPALIPVSKTAWWAGVKAGRYPKPIKLSPRVTVWRAADIRALIDSFS